MTDSKVKALKKLSVFGIHTLRILHIILVKIFNVCRMGMCDVGKILHKSVFSWMISVGKYRVKNGTKGRKSRRTKFALREVEFLQNTWPGIRKMDPSFVYIPLPEKDPASMGRTNQRPF
jgi:hypothetical protein